MDDLLIAYNSSEERGHEIKQLLYKKYKMCDLGTAKRFLEIQIERTKDRGFSICQQGYINKIISQFGLMDAKPPKSPLDPQTDPMSVNSLITYIYGTRKSTGYNFQHHSSELAQCPTS